MSSLWNNFARRFQFGLRLSSEGQDQTSGPAQAEAANQAPTSGMASPSSRPLPDGLQIKVNGKRVTYGQSDIPLTTPELVAAAKCLSIRLHSDVPHIVDTILDYAQLWDITTTTFIKSVALGERTQPMNYVVSFPVLGDPAIPTWGTERLNDTIGYKPFYGTVRKAVFEVCGHDQGWASGPGSWTWWVLSKYNPNQEVDIDESNNLDDDSDQYKGPARTNPRPVISVPVSHVRRSRFNESHADAATRPSAAENVFNSNDDGGDDDEDDDGDDYDSGFSESDGEPDDHDEDIAYRMQNWPDGPELAKNVRADDTPRTYRVEVDCTAGAEGEIAEFVRSLKPGDRVSIKPKARYPGWVCYTDWARITVYTMTYRS